MSFYLNHQIHIAASHIHFTVIITFIQAKHILKTQYQDALISFLFKEHPHIVKFLYRTRTLQEVNSQSLQSFFFVNFICKRFLIQFLLEISIRSLRQRQDVESLLKYKEKPAFSSQFSLKNSVSALKLLQNCLWQRNLMRRHVKSSGILL